MGRLTERLGDYNNPKEICAVWVKNHGYVGAAHRLADYEDITDTVCGFDRLRELAQADKDGRLVGHGRWVDGKCSNCGVDIPTDDAHDAIFENECRFCYYCGAKMDGGDKRCG